MSDLLKLKWQQGETDRAFVYALDPTEGGNIFYLQVQPDYVNGKRTTPKQVAEVGNAIAALPDLLKSCEALVKAMRDYQLDVGEEPPYKHRAMMRDAVAAIAKAKGE